MNPNLTPEECEAVAHLTQNLGYKLLMESIKAEIDDMADELFAADTNERESRLLSDWKAMRRVYLRLSTTPADITEALKSEPVLDAPDVIPLADQADYAEKLRLYYKDLDEKGLTPPGNPFIGAMPQFNTPPLTLSDLGTKLQ